MDASNLPAQAPAGLDEAHIAVRGVGGPVLQAGPPDAREAVLFLHGNPGSGDDFRDLLHETGTFARAVAPHMPGFGRADKPRDFRYDDAGYADHLHGLLEQMGIDRVQATATRPLFRVLTNRGQKRKLSRAFLDHMYDVNFTRPTRRAVLKVYRNSPRPAEDGARQAAALRPHDIPALVLWGAHDPYLGLELAEAQREAFPSAQIVVLEDSGHWPFADDPEATRDAVVPFLRRQVTSSLTKGQSL